MITATALAILTLAQTAPPGDTIPLPPLDTAWSRLTRVGIQGTDLPERADVWILLDRWGRVEQAIADSTAGLGERGRDLLESRVKQLRFVPPDKRPGWARFRVQIDPAGPAPAAPAPSGDRVEYTPFTRAPRLADRTAATRALQRYYPKELADSGIGGTAKVWVFVDTLGRVLNTQIERGTGHRALDEAAEQAAAELRFSPAENAYMKVPVWVVIPLTFGSKERRTYRSELQRSFTLGSIRHPVAEGSASASLDRFPELIQPEVAESILTGFYLDSDPNHNLYLFVEFLIRNDGFVRSVRVLDRHPEVAEDSSLSWDLNKAIRRLRFRPALESGRPVPAKTSAHLVFDRGVGLIPSVAPFECAVDSGLRAEPRPAKVDRPPELATPRFERDRVVAATWPIALQEEGAHWQFDSWLLIDERGHVCGTRLLNLSEDRWLASKARALVRRLRFRPALREGVPVAAWRRELIEFSF